MKKYSDIIFVSGLKSQGNLLTAAALIFSVLSCSTLDLEEISPENSASAKQERFAAESSSAIITEITFTATALIAYCHGENIRFTGTIENRVTKTTDAGGVIHYTRSFNTKGMTAVGLTSGTEYDVIGGAEMFAIKDAVFTNGTLNLSASLSESDIVIHQGTLVFQSRTDGSRVIARHIIRKVPGSETVINKWECQGN